MIAAPSVILSHALPPADSPEMLEALTALPVPFVRQWLGESVRQHTLTTSAEDLVLPAEWARAETLGWTSPHGTWPWAALSAPLAPAPHAASQSAWAFIRLCHWQVGNGQFTLLDPGPITQEESNALMASMRTYFEEDGITLQAHEPGRWLAQSSLFDGLACASAERVMGLPIEPWLLGAHLPSLSPAIRTLRRLQNEMQMLLYQHPVNDARLARGLQAVNAFWVHGAGQLPPNAKPTGVVQMIDRLRDSALRGDVGAWRAAWQALDAQLPAPDTPGLQLTLCSESSAQHWQAQPGKLLARLRQVFSSPDTSATLRALLTNP